MRFFPSMNRGAGLLVAVILVLIAGTGSANASVISATPTLPILNVPYISTTGAGCFPAVSVCIKSGMLTLTSALSSFDAQGQDILSDASFSGILTDLNQMPIGTVSLSGTVEQEIFQRFSPTDTGTWQTELTAVTLSGLIFGQTLNFTLASSPASTGVTSITPFHDEFKIDSFFDVFADISFGALHTQRGPIRVQAVPEPAILQLLSVGLAGLILIRLRHRKVTQN